jgi:mannitol/fructose-specific phosphotransferase system IIA component (Ntr-type)
MPLPQTHISLTELIRPERVLELDCATRDEALRALCTAASRDARVLDVEALYRAVLKREDVSSTGVGMGIAIPHVKIPQVTDYIIGVGRHRAGLDFKALDGRPVHLIFLICASDHQTREFVKMLAQVTHLLKDEAIRREMLEAAVPHGFLDVVRKHAR